jgi:hypothetical protein
MFAAPHHALVIAARTAEYPGLIEALRFHALHRPTGFTLLVPAVAPGFAVVTDPGAGWPLAIARAEHAAERLRGAGVEVRETIVGDADPLLAAGDALHARRFDEVVLATLPHGLSSWLDAGLPARLRRLAALPVTTLALDAPARSALVARQLAAAA